MMTPQTARIRRSQRLPQPARGARGRRLRGVTLVSAFCLVFGALTLARFSAAGSKDPELHLPNGFCFARVRFDSRDSWGRYPGWVRDYPVAELKLLRILGSTTAIDVDTDCYGIVQLNDPQIMNFPLLYLSSPGTWTISDDEASNFREYLSRGGFAVFDRFEGADQWRNFERCMKKVFPDRDLVRLSLEEPIFHTLFDIKTLQMKVSHTIHVRDNPIFYGLFDEAGRIQVIANFNNDIGHLWEFAGQGFTPIPISNEAFKFGVNYVIYAMTH